MKTWLKGGLIGAIIGLIAFMLIRLSEKCPEGMECANSPLSYLIFMLYFILIGFIIGVIIGLIIQKIKSKKKRK